MHAALVAEDLGVTRVLVPRNPGAFSALGLLCSDVRHDYLRSEMASLATLDPARAESCFEMLEDQARRELAHEGLGDGDAIFLRELDLRYAGQGYELRVALEGVAAPLDADALSAIARRFHAQHAAVHGHCAEDSDVEIVSYRLRAIVQMRKYAPLPQLQVVAVAPQIRGERRVTLGPHRAFDAAIVRRDDIETGWRAQGPVIIEQKDSTTLVPDGWSVRCDEWSNLILERAPA